MPKMKHLLRKFHIGSGVADQNPPTPAPVLDPPLETSRFEESESPSSESPRTTPSLTAALPVTDESNSADFNFFEEEFQVQLALAISASDPDSRDDPESAQIKAAQQISLACSPSGNLVQFLSLRYWNYNVVNYNEKVMDGFYDVYGINPSVVVQGKMPLLADLKGISVLDTVDYEVILVNRATDMELRQLEESVYFLSRECWSLEKVPNMSFLVQKIADIVVNRMGGPVSDAEEISKRWTARSYELRMSLNTIVLPLGCLDIGHSRHRALLFKVLADRINLPCNLVKGSYYTGTDVGAVNLIKFDNGSEYMIDLMGAPGALIPTEAPSGQLQSCALNIHGVTPVPFGGNIISSFPVHHTETGTESGSLTARLEGLSVSHDNTFTTQRMHIREASECDISPAKNLESKLQGNLPENRMSLHSDLFLGAVENQLSENRVIDTRQSSTNNEQSLIAFTGGQFPGNISFKGYRKHSNEVWKFEQQEEQHIVAAPGHNASYDTSDKNCTNKDNESAIKAMELVTCIQSKSYTGQKEQLDPMLHEVASWEIPWEDLHVGERIGIGSFGEVYHAEWNGTEVAVKKFMNQDITSDALAQFKCEVEIMLRLRHPNVVLFMGAVTRPPNLSILTEFLPRGGLYRLLHRPNIQIDEKKRMRMALDVAKGMNYLHTSNPIIVHRDLKTPNLLVDKNWVVKVCDFGMSRMKHHTFLSSKSTAGTAEWMAPEVLRNEPSNEKSDVYSFGVILWELATLEVPWSGMNSMQVVGAVGFQGRRLDIPATVDHAVAEIIMDCWNQNSQVRPHFGQIITRLKCLQRLNIPGSEACTNQQ